MPEKCETLEELRWMPGLADCDLKMYLRAARSMAAFAGMCDGGSAEDGCLAASRDDTTINALQLLHESNYDTGKALQALVKSPVPKGIEKKWTEEEQKRFTKGLRLYGKNFFKIRKELLSHKETPDLVEYYYLWKKTPQAASARPHRRHRRCVLRRIRNSNNASGNSNSQSKSNPAIKDDGNSSGSEEEVDQTDDSDSNANTELTCSNCGMLAKELRQTGNDRSLLCHDCRSYMKKHGKHRPLSDKELLKSSSKSEDDSNLSNGKPNLRTRKGKDKCSSKVELNRANSKFSENGSPEQNEINSTESSSSSNEAKQTNGSSTSSENETKKSEIPKKRHFSSLDNDSTNEGETNENDDSKEDDSDNKRKKFSNLDDMNDDADEDDGDGDDEKSDDDEQRMPLSNPDSTAEPKPKVEEADCANTAEKLPTSITVESDDTSEPKIENATNPPPAQSEPTKPIEAIEKAESGIEANSSKSEPESEKIAVPDTAASTAVSETVASDEKNEPPLVPKMMPASENVAVNDTAHAAAVATENDKHPQDDSLLSNMKTEPSSPKSPQDLSLPSTRDREKKAENVPSTANPQIAPAPIPTTATPSAISPIIKKEDNVALNFSTSSTNKISPASSPNPLMFPFSQQFAQMPPTIVPPTSMADRFPYLMPQLNFPPAIGMPQEAVTGSPKLPPAPPEMNEKLEIPEPKLKEEPPSKPIDPPQVKNSNIKNESGRSLQSPKTNPAATQYPNIASQFGPASNDAFLMANQNFAAAHLGPGAERLPFSNPFPSPFPPGFPPHLANLPPFMGPWSQFGARLPPGAFPTPPYMQSPANPINSHSPHAQMSKSKSPITSQSGSHHNSPSHFSSHSAKSHEMKESFERRERDMYQPDDEEIENQFLPRGPSPEPKIEDSECHRSQSAIFLRHWNRGDYNSCARTDLTFKPVPDSQLSRKREERARKAAEKERDDHKVWTMRHHESKTEKPPPIELKSSNHGSSSQAAAQAAAAAAAAAAASGGAPNHEANNSHLVSPHGGRHTPRNFTDTPTLRQLSEYARPHTTYSPFPHPQQMGPHHMGPSNIPPMGLHGPNSGGGAPSIDPIALAQYQMLKDAEEKQKMAILEKQKEMEMKSRSTSQAPSHNPPNMPPTSSANSIFEQNFLEMQRRLAGSAGQALSGSPSMANNPNTSNANGLSLPGAPPPGSSINPFMPMFGSAANERAAQEQMQQMAAAVAAADRYQVDRLAMDPLFRLQMSMPPELHGAVAAAAAAGAPHPFQHPQHSVHPSGHPGANANAAENAAASMQLAASAAAAMGLQGTQFDPALHASHASLLQSAAAYPSRPPSIMPRPELAQQSSLFRSFEDQLTHQLSAQAQAQAQLQHEHLQRQILMERERMMHYSAAAAAQLQHPQFQLQEEFLRQQRDRELKSLRSFEDSRNGRPPM